MKKFILFGVISGLLISCSIEKRLYRQGFFVQNHGKVQKNQENSIVEKSGQFVEPSALLVADNGSSEHFYALDVQLHQFTERYQLLNETKGISTKKNRKEMSTAQVDAQKVQQTNDIKLKEQTQKRHVLSPERAQRRGNNEQIIALLLCFFLGYLGVHSFYLGNTTKGIIQLAMFLVGCVFWITIIGVIFAAMIWIALEIWVLIDFIRIIVGDLGPGW